MTEVVVETDNGVAAATIAGNNPQAVRSLLASYKRVEAESVGAGYTIEESTARAWYAENSDYRRKPSAAWGSTISSGAHTFFASPWSCEYSANFASTCRLRSRP